MQRHSRRPGAASTIYVSDGFTHEVDAIHAPSAVNRFFENSIEYSFSKTVALAGKPDLIAVRKSGATICEVKTGQPKTSDSVEAMIYTHLIPLVIPRFHGTRFAGFIV